MTVRSVRNAMFVFLVVVANTVFAPRALAAESDWCDHYEQTGYNTFEGYGCGTCDNAFAQCANLCWGPGFIGVSGFYCGEENGPFTCTCYVWQ